jgi:hypothetical protein
MSDDDQDGHEPSSRHRALVGLLLIVVLAAAVLFVIHELQDSARMQDCFASGRTNCAPIDTTRH